MAATLPTLDEIRAAVREEIERALAGRPLASPAEWATPEQAAERLGVSAKTVRRWCASGRLRAERHGRSWRIDRAGLPDPRPATPEGHGLAALVALAGRR